MCRRLFVLFTFCYQIPSFFFFLASICATSFSVSAYVENYFFTTSNVNAMSNAILTLLVKMGIFLLYNTKEFIISLLACIVKVIYQCLCASSACFPQHNSLSCCCVNNGLKLVYNLFHIYFIQEGFSVLNKYLLLDWSSTACLIEMETRFQETIVHSRQ